MVSSSLFLDEKRLGHEQLSSFLCLSFSLNSIFHVAESLQHPRQRQGDQDGLEQRAVSIVTCRTPLLAMRDANASLPPARLPAAGNVLPTTTESLNENDLYADCSLSSGAMADRQ